jgi:hypothetical protein
MIPAKMTTETIIIRCALEKLFTPAIIHQLVRDGYQKTGNKFSIHFHGSKGYLDHISITCEGFQSEDNRIDSNKIFNAGGSIKREIVNVYHSEANGVRVSLGKDKARVVKQLNWFDSEPGKAEGEDYLPF